MTPTEHTYTKSLSFWSEQRGKRKILEEYMLLGQKTDPVQIKDLVFLPRIRLNFKPKSCMQTKNLYSHIVKIVDTLVLKNQLKFLIKD